MTGRHVPRRLQQLAVILVCAGLSLGGASHGQISRLSLTTGALPPLTASANHPGFLNELARAAFKRIGVEVDVTAVPTERSLINANAGLDDGDLFRVAGVERQYPNLIRVPEKTMDADFIAYTKRTDIRIRAWPDLQPYVIAYTTGWKIYEAHMNGVREVTTTPSIQELIRLIDKDRVDVILMDYWQGQWALRQAGSRLHAQTPPLAQVEIFMYLNKKHAALVPRVAQALRDMKADGSYQRIFDATLKPLDMR
jgi:polar amino acid transport system substrate-binding protein